MNRWKGAIQARRGLLREGVALRMAAQHDIELLGAVATGPELIALCSTTPGDFVVFEADAHEWDPLGLARVLRARHRALRLVATCSDGAGVLATAFAGAGVSTMVQHEGGISDLLAAVRRACEEPAPAATDGERDAPPLETPLTPRQLEVLVLIGAGFSAPEIAARLRISPKTVDNHKQRIYAKLGVQSQAHAVAVAIRAGLIGATRDASGGVAS